MIIPICCIIVAVVLFAIGWNSIAEGEIGAVFISITAVSLIFVSVMGFCIESRRNHATDVLDFLVSEKKVTLVVNQKTKDVSYVLVDSSYSSLFSKLKKDAIEW